MKRWLAVVVCLSALAFPQDRTKAVEDLERCIRQSATAGKKCKGEPLEKVLALYDAGDTGLVPLILRSYNTPRSVKQVYIGQVYLQIFEAHPQDFVAAAAGLTTGDEAAVNRAFSVATIRTPDGSLRDVREKLAAINAPEASAGYSKRLLYEVEMENAARLQQYFPEGTFTALGRVELDRARQHWYARALFALHESPIFSEQVAPRNGVYRFLWLRTFHRPLSVRLHVFPDGHGIATLRESDGAGGYNPGKLSADAESQLSAEDVKAFLQLLDKANYWTEPTEPPPSDTVGFDGARWVLEARDGARYHIVDRWSPGSGPYREAALFLLKKSGFAEKKNDPVY